MFNASDKITEDLNNPDEKSLTTETEYAVAVALPTQTPLIVFSKQKPASAPMLLAPKYRIKKENKSDKEYMEMFIYYHVTFIFSFYCSYRRLLRFHLKINSRIVPETTMPAGDPRPA